MAFATTDEKQTWAVRWAELKVAEPHTRIRDAALKLGTSEATLLSTLLGAGVTRLRCEPASLLPRLEPLGRLMALTRNDAVVHERHGVYQNVKVTGNVGLLANPDIDLRLDLSVWKAAFAEEKFHAGQKLRSLQFFDAQGVAIHKIYLKDGAGSALELWNSLVAEYTDADQSSLFEPAPGRPPVAEVPYDEATRSQFVEAWGTIQDPHHFHGLLKKHGLSRRQGLVAAEGRFTRPLAPQKLDALLEGVTRQGVPIMVFVHNPGCVQIHTGPVVNFQVMGTWRNILDPEFNLHFDLSLAAQAWAVTKPSESGPVTSVEFLDADGQLLVQFFGKRKPGIPELVEWRSLVEAL